MSRTVVAVLIVVMVLMLSLSITHAAGIRVGRNWTDNRNACDTIDPTFGCIDQDIYTATITP